jgi:hypothetical protein
MKQYNLDYFENMLRMYSRSAQHISEIRWDFIKDCGNVILDYGCGCGWFRAFRPKEKTVDSFDVGGYPQLGIRHEKYDCVCFWDVLEHVDWKRNPDKHIEEMFKITKYVALTVPILPEGQDPNTWKHTKEGEHLTRFEKINEVIEFFKKRKFKIIKVGSPECPPRLDIYSFVFKRI